MGAISTEMEHGGQVARIRLNTPKANIMDGPMMSALTEAFLTLPRQPELKMMVVEGAGAHFSFGASVEEHQAEPCKEMIPAFGRMFSALLASGVPSLALVRGQCLGGAMELAIGCNWIFAEPGAKFGQPEIQLAVFPPLASLLLPFLVGQRASDDLCLTGRSIDALEGQRLGLVHTVSAEPEEAVQTFAAEHILPKSAAALRLANRASRFRFQSTFEAGWGEMERLYLKDLMSTADANEGIAAFLEKRAPKWINK